ncbi:MAG: hypothetical protein JJT78_05855, partial [Leptospira sp.]|nr:hypothetical protein [Leptospira sp.]
NCIFVLKHDLPMIKKVEEELRNYFFKRGEFFGNFMAYHHSKQEKFSRKRSKLLDELNYLTFKLVNFPKDTKVSHWKQKKELKLKRLEYILNHGLYSGSELADIFQIEHFKLRRKLSNMKFQWGKLPYPNGEFPQSEAA